MSQDQKIVKDERGRNSPRTRSEPNRTQRWRAALPTRGTTRMGHSRRATTTRGTASQARTNAKVAFETARAILACRKACGASALIRSARLKDAANRANETRGDYRRRE